MSSQTAKKSRKLVSGAVLAAVMGGATQITIAEPGDILGVTSEGGDFSVQSFVHTFLGPPTTYGLSIYPMTVSSAVSDRPGFQFELTWDLAAFGTDFFLPTDLFYVELEIKAPGTNIPIVAILVKDVSGQEILDWVDLTNTGIGYTDGTIGVAIPFAHLQGAGQEFFTIQWAQIPGPGGIALLGIFGTVGCRRRRRA